MWGLESESRAQVFLYIPAVEAEMLIAFQESDDRAR